MNCDWFRVAFKKLLKLDKNNFETNNSLLYFFNHFVNNIEYSIDKYHNFNVWKYNKTFPHSKCDNFFRIIYLSEYMLDSLVKKPIFGWWIYYFINKYVDENGNKISMAKLALILMKWIHWRRVNEIYLVPFWSSLYPTIISKKINQDFEMKFWE